MKKEKTKKVTPRKAAGVIGVVLCLLIAPILIVNIILIVESFVNPDEVPGLIGITPMVVVTDSMKPTISGGDMVVDMKTDPKDVKVGDIISFFDPTRPDRDVVITHRVVRIEEGETISFYTKGDANNTEDPVPVPEDLLVGVYRFTIPLLGSIVLFMRTTVGVIVSVVLPVLAIIAYELLKVRKREKEQRAEAEKLRAEVESLKDEKAGPRATADCSI